MSDLFVIDGSNGKFTQKRWNTFCSYITSEDESINIKVDSLNNDFTYNELIILMKTQEFVDFFKSHMNSICEFTSNFAKLIVDTNDIVYWTKQKNGEFIRIDKLLSEAKINCANKPKERANSSKRVKSTSTNNTTLMKVAASIQTETDVEDITLFEGDTKSCVKFINEYYSKQSIRTHFDDSKKIMFIINYTSEDDLLVDNNWKTIQQLEIEGVIKTI